MLSNGQPFSHLSQHLYKNALVRQSVNKLVDFLERRLQGTLFVPAEEIPWGREDLFAAHELFRTMRDAGIVTSASPVRSWPDEPRFPMWRVEYAGDGNDVAGGMSLTKDHDALIPALAESLERYLWRNDTSYFENPRHATVQEIGAEESILLPERFVGFTHEQRKQNKHLTLSPGDSFLWIDGYSETSQRAVTLPAQIVSAAHAMKRGPEPLISSPITTGLATGPTRSFAALNGVLEILERDAFMITWLNQMTPPRVDLNEIASQDPRLEQLMNICERYRLKMSAVSLPTDAPVHVICVVIEDLSLIGPSVTIGLKAHRSVADAILGAGLEALRIRHTVRFRNIKNPLDPDKSKNKLVHTERAQYWARPDGYQKLSFLSSGTVHKSAPAAWENDSIEQHWQRIVDWAKSERYECVTVDIGRSARNVTPWKVIMVVMPDMQPMHQNESLIYSVGDRLKSVPEKLGYTARQKPYTEEPHPFA